MLQATADLAGTTVTVEEELLFGTETTPWVGIYLERRDAPSGTQSLSGGQQTRYRLRFSIWCWEYHLESLAKAMQRRDDLIGKVEVALMGNRTLNANVITSWIEGGEMPSVRAPGTQSWLAGGEVVLIADAKATT